MRWNAAAWQERHENGMTRHISLILGWLAVGLGMIGIALPLLPTVPFMILAAFLFARGSPRAHAWLTGHARFGPHIQAWQETGGIARRAKLAAILAMAIVLGISVVLALPLRLIAIQAVCMMGAALFILTRPDA